MGTVTGVFDRSDGLEAVEVVGVLVRLGVVIVLAGGTMSVV